jgi:RNA polymerase sigma-70 factor (ECF subfamily)
VVALREGRLEDPAKLGAFVHGIARHVIADAQRSGRFAPRLPDTAGSDPAAPDRDPLLELISAEEKARVNRLLGRLSAAEREVLRLSYFEGLTPSELAPRLGEPAPRIRKRKERALKRLRLAFASANPTGHEERPRPTDQRGALAQQVPLGRSP